MDVRDLQAKIIKFRDQRNWKQFHNPKDMSLSLVLEAAEVMEHFQWKNAEEMEKYVKTHKQEIGEELADTLYWVLLLSHDLNIDLSKAFVKKMVKNVKKYPIKEFKGKHSKHKDLT